MNLICIKCPRGCNLEVDGEKVTGNLCPRGIDYAREEQTCPVRTVTALLQVGKKVYPVKTDKEVPKAQIKAVLAEIANVNVKNLKCGDIIIENVLNTGANVVVTGNCYEY